MKNVSIYLRPYTVDWNNPESDSIHLEYSYDKENWYSLNGNNGVLFAKSGSRRMSEPQIIKMSEDRFKIYAKDSLDTNKVFVYETSDFISYSDETVVECISLDDYNKPGEAVEISQELLSQLNKVYGKPEPVVIESVEEVKAEVNVGEELKLPEKVKVTYSNGMTEMKR